MDSLHYYIGFNLVQGIGPMRLRALIEAFGDVERAWHAPATALRAAGLDRRSLNNLLASRSQLDLVKEEGLLEILISFSPGCYGEVD